MRLERKKVIDFLKISCAPFKQTLKDSDTYEVVIGTENMMQKYGIAVDEITAVALSVEQQKGHISVLCAINSKFPILKELHSLLGKTTLRHLLIADK